MSPIIHCSFLVYISSFFSLSVQPKVKVSGRESGDTTKLHCVVYGFHPRAVDVRWMKNGVDDVPTYETTHVLPNPDGTYQIRVSVDVISNEVDNYLLCGSQQPGGAAPCAMGTKAELLPGRDLLRDGHHPSCTFFCRCWGYFIQK
ncbi:hypothetical protein GDO81_023959 [Engystomops pustulosus]|uniref:Ig-like domain-containing protein n=1 Tax=Engystomops pustulosus TaxID=76066 RepID=A0AAV6ZIE3_ENGPU|nr:hypothetical protein GDO81_023959 [Engystomops pustulosus]